MMYFETLQQFERSGGLKQTTITAKQLLPAMVAHIKRMDRKFTLYLNGRLPKPLTNLLQDAFDVMHLQHPFFTQHCASQQTSYRNISKNKIKIDFTIKYRMPKEHQLWVMDEIKSILTQIVHDTMSDFEKMVTVHDYIVRNHQYEMNTTGSPFTVYTFMHEKQGVCMAYALLFEKMMEHLNIPCYYVLGKADGESDLGHAWNMVQLEDEWYHIDATWNDLGSKNLRPQIRFRYFLRSDAFMKRDHIWNFNHYPLCTSEKYKGLSNVYDGALYEHTLYLPHPKTAHFTKMAVNQLHFETIEPVRVQCTTEWEGEIYYSHYDDQGFLYKYDPQTDTHILLEKRQVEKIVRKQQQLTVYFKVGEVLTLEKQYISVDTVEKIDEVEFVEVPLMALGDSWFASYEGEENYCRFTSVDGVVVCVYTPFTQLTLHISLETTLELTITSNRKPITVERKIHGQFPKALFSKALIKSNENSSSHLTISEHHIDVYITQSETFIFEKKKKK